MEDNYIYLDNASTTIPSKEVVSLFEDIELNHFGNSGSIHKLGVDASSYLSKARESILNTLKLNGYKVYFTSSSTEANNLAIKGYCYNHANRGKHIITSIVEHPSVLECFKELEKDGFKVTYLGVNHDGIVSLDELNSVIDNDTILVSIMSVNNEIGSVNPVKEISEIVHKYPKAVFHSDTTQSIGKTNDIDYNYIDLFVISSHKIHGLKGGGALIAKSNIVFDAVINGGGQEDGKRSGTVSVSQACCLAKALKMSYPVKSVKVQHDYLINELKKIDGIELNSNNKCLPGIINFSLTKKKAAVVVEALSNKGIYVSSVSACHSKGEAMSYVVKALGKSDELAHNTIRVSLSELTTIDELSVFIKTLKEILETIK